MEPKIEQTRTQVEKVNEMIDSQSIREDDTVTIKSSTVEFDNTFGGDQDVPQARVRFIKVDNGRLFFSYNDKDYDLAYPAPEGSKSVNLNDITEIILER